MVNRSRRDAVSGGWDPAIDPNLTSLKPYVRADPLKDAPLTQLQHDIVRPMADHRRVFERAAFITAEGEEEMRAFAINIVQQVQLGVSLQRGQIQIIKK